MAEVLLSEDPLKGRDGSYAPKGINSVLEYSLVDGDTSTFSLDKTNGKVHLRRPLSELRGNSYDLRVSVKDKKGRKSTENAILSRKSPQIGDGLCLPTIRAASGKLVCHRSTNVSIDWTYSANAP